ncbi:lipoyl(octanoyl) transferase LipB [Foetidibacter luteolus]|uniref:lipoyl(octanoyl) transferase LipB n=1 Tax=Foetidibacter luteolus TaxID=2608880 RepID=UPI00129A3BB5|nr:lipoyl(octanoyl) transferase LipB [Foetidibacter luteolus]
MMNQVLFTDMGRQPAYAQVWNFQEGLLQQKVKQKSGGEKPAQHLLFVEHAPVYTLGKNGKAEHVLISETERLEKNIEYFHINRGGDITFHGPGQVVGYPIFDLEQFKTDLGWYLRSLEEVIILTMAEYGLYGERSKGETGVWLEPSVPGRERKICAMGIRCSRWVTMHGFAFNVNTDLNFFNYIVPCGIQNKQVTSLAKELGHDVNVAEAKEKLKRNFCRVFNVQMLDEPVYSPAGGELLLSH